MKELESFLSKIERVMKEHDQYKFEGYSFVMSGLHYTVTRLPKQRHITGKELLEGIREYALEQFGPLTKTVLNYWGIFETEDFGKIVFALVEVGVLRKQPQDKIEDFRNIYSFDDVFKASFVLED
jgi:uncharacterized repeat protein (TIGR04138 family)